MSSFTLAAKAVRTGTVPNEAKELRHDIRMAAIRDDTSIYGNISYISEKNTPIFLKVALLPQGSGPAPGHASTTD